MAKYSFENYIPITGCPVQAILYKEGFPAVGTVEIRVQLKDGKQSSGIFDGMSGDGATVFVTVDSITAAIRCSDVSIAAIIPMQ